MARPLEQYRGATVDYGSVAFRDGRLRFTGIVDAVAEVVTRHDVGSPADLTLDDVLAADAWARSEATRVIERSAT